MGQEKGHLLNWRVRVGGRVQGVNFRRWTQALALRAGICGWVLNEPDGSVTAVLQHEDERVLLEMLEALRNGPPAAVVQDMEVERGLASEPLAGFEILR
jgi:acylphosphatase